MERKASVKFIIKKGNNDFFTEFEFLDKKIKVEEESYLFDVAIEKFNGTNNSFASIIELFNAQTSKQFLINIYKCLNIFYLYLSKEGYTFELIISDEYDFKDLRNNNMEYQFDDNGNKHRIRISLINYGQLTIEINNNFNFNPFDYCSQNTENKNSYNSFQLSLYSKDKIIFRKNELFQTSINIFSFYGKYSETISNSYNKIEQLLKKESFSINILKCTTNAVIQINNEFNKLNLQKSKSELEIAFNDEKYIEFFFQLLVHKYLINKCDKINKAEDLSHIINKFTTFKTKLSEDKDLKIYQKIFGLIQYYYISRKYDCWNTYYIKIKEAKDQSILSKAILFYKKFIENIDEESPVFFKLLEINSKFGYLNDKPIYNLSLLNDQDIKEHLLELVPEVIFFFNCDSNTKAFVFSMTGELAINEKLLFNKYEKMNLIDNYDKKDKYNAENISMTIARYFLHEESGHFKFRNKTNIKNNANSPIKCISEGRIKSLTYFGDKKESDDLIKIFSADKKGKGDSGHYLETAFGKYMDVYCIVYFDFIKNVGKLLNFPEYFVKKEYLPTLQKYLFFKYVLEKKKIEVTWYEELSLDDEIKLMKELLEKESPNKLSEINLDNQNKSDIISPKEIEYSEDEPTINKLEGNDYDYESSYTEDKPLKGIYSYNIEISEEPKSDINLLKKKRNMKDKDEISEQKEDNNNSNQKIGNKSNVTSNEKEKKVVNLDSMNESEILRYFNAEIPYEYHVESEDDEASI